MIKRKRFKIFAIIVIIVVIIYNILLSTLGLQILYYAPQTISSIKNTKMVVDIHDAFCDPEEITDPEEIIDVSGEIYVLHSNRMLYIYRYGGKGFNHENILEQDYMDVIEYAMKRRISIKEYHELIENCKKYP